MSEGKQVTIPSEILEATKAVTELIKSVTQTSVETKKGGSGWFSGWSLPWGGNQAISVLREHAREERKQANEWERKAREAHAKWRQHYDAAEQYDRMLKELSNK